MYVNSSNHDEVTIKFNGKVQYHNLPIKIPTNLLLKSAILVNVLNRSGNSIYRSIVNVN